MFLRNVLFAMVGVAVLVAITAAILDGNSKVVMLLQAGVELVVRWIGIAVALAGIVELAFLAGTGTRKHMAPRAGAPADSSLSDTREPFARWTVVALIGLTVAQPNWATAVAAGAVVVAVALAGVIAPSRQNEPVESTT